MTIQMMQMTIQKSLKYKPWLSFYACQKKYVKFNDSTLTIY